VNPSARQPIPVADLGSHDLEIPTVLRARQVAAAYGYDHGLAQGAMIDAVAISESERRIAAHVLAAIHDAPPGLSPDQKPTTRAERAREIIDRAITDLAAVGVECQASAHRETEVGAAMAGAPVLSLNLSATVHAPDEVIP
jgi:hypothetical protein